MRSRRRTGLRNWRAARRPHSRRWCTIGGAARRAARALSSSFRPWSHQWRTWWARVHAGPVVAGVGAVLVAAHQLATLGPVEQAGLTALVEVLALGAQDAG